MPQLVRAVLVVVVLVGAAATATADPVAALANDPSEPPIVTATAQVRVRLQQLWQELVTSSRSHGRWRVVVRGATLGGDWVVHVGRYSYLLDGGSVRCSVQWAEAVDAPAYLMCGERDAVELQWSATTSAAPLQTGGKVSGRIEVTADARQPPLDVALLAKLSRAIVGPQLAITIDRGGIGHAVVETIVSTPPASTGRQSWRYAVDVRLTATGFAIGLPRLVEHYAETCMSVQGCHDVYWTCVRVY